MDKFVLALTKLCEESGGYARVADAIGSSPATIDQIIKQVKLPSGNPKGVGPSLRRRLDVAYPGWSDVEPVGSVFHALTADEFKFLEDFRQLMDTDKEHYTEEIAIKAKAIREHIARVIGPFQTGHKVERKS
jgi:hypothetical protein